MVVRIHEACAAVQRRLHKVLWNGGAILPALCVYNILDFHNIPCTVVSGYFRPPVAYLRSQAAVDGSSGFWLPHVWVEVDGYDDPIIDVYSIGGNVYEFCKLHNIHWEDRESFVKKAGDLGYTRGDAVYRELMTCHGIPTASKVLGNTWRLHKDSKTSEYCLNVPSGEESVEQFGIPKHQLDELVASPNWPNGTYFKGCSPGAKKLFSQVIQEPYLDDHDNVEMIETHLKASSDLVKSSNLLKYEEFVQENWEFLNSLEKLPEKEIMKHVALLDRYRHLSESLTTEDKAVMSMIANQKEQDRLGKERATQEAEAARLKAEASVREKEERKAKRKLERARVKAAMEAEKQASMKKKI